MMVVTKICSLSDRSQAVHLRFLHFSECESHFNKSFNKETTHYLDGIKGTSCEGLREQEGGCLHFGGWQQLQRQE